jgi:hypothetical protein
VKHLAILLPLWLALAVGEPSLVHQCPMHAGGHAPAQRSAGQGEHAHHGAPSTPEQRHPQSCNCITGCVGAAAIVVADAVVVPVARVVPLAPMTPTTSLFVAQRAAHPPLPYPNGPPALVG